jgi:predicted nuclease of predicted toxin-antitoxin system
MGGSDWGFLLDENVGRAVAAELAQYGHRAELVVDALGPGVDDYPDVVPYARKHDLIIITKDVSDFSAIDSGSHQGIILIVHHTYTAAKTAAAVNAIAQAYPSREAFAGRQEYLDDWVR